MSTIDAPPDDGLDEVDTHVPEAWLDLYTATEAKDIDLAGMGESPEFRAAQRSALRVPSDGGGFLEAARRRSRRANRSPAHLSREKRRHARDLTCHALGLMHEHSDDCGYSEASDRWEWHASLMVAARGEFPRESDCSSSAAWALWQGIHHAYGRADVVNAEKWLAGFTGSMIMHGLHAGPPAAWMRGDAIIFGSSVSDTVHTAINVGWDKRYKSHMVINHGTPGAIYMKWSDLLSVAPVAGIRRYI